MAILSILSIVVLVGMITETFAQAAISQCSNLSSGTYVLDANVVSATDTCFTVEGHNVVLDGANNTLTGPGSGKGIYNSRYDNFTVKNFANITNFQTHIFIRAAKNATIRNNTLHATNKGARPVRTSNTTLTTIANNTIMIQGDHSQAIFVFRSFTSTITNNTINTTNDGSNSILNILSETSNISNNTISTAGENSQGIADTVSSESTIAGNIVSATRINSVNIHVFNSTRATILNNSLTTLQSNSPTINVFASTGTSISNNALTTLGVSRSIGIITIRRPNAQNRTLPTLNGNNINTQRARDRTKNITT